MADIVSQTFYKQVYPRIHAKYVVVYRCSRYVKWHHVGHSASKTT